MSLRASRPALILLIPLCVLVWSSPSQARERLFSYTYESASLGRGQVEIEPWVTSKIMRDHFYYRMDSRLEFEWGLGKNVQTAFYLMFRAQAEDDGSQIVGSTAFRGIKNEWKFSVLDPVKDPLGLAMYFEYGLQPHEVEFEGKAIFDKQIGKVTLALNLVGEVELKVLSGGGVEPEGGIELDFGTAFRLSPAIGLGFELREAIVLADGRAQTAILSLGPAISFHGESVWAVITVLPQLIDFVSLTHNVQSSEWVEVRAVIGINQLFSLL